MAPGDIFTHAFAYVSGRTPIVDAGGALRPCVRTARERGVLFDVGYGAKSFSFGQAGPAIAAGFWPDTISSDAHRSSARGSMHDLVAVVSKLVPSALRAAGLSSRSTSSRA